jgi:hypothetical protein
MSKCLPDFLGVGASRSGTTTLYDFLDRHPQVFMANPKEIHYFTFRHPEFGSTRPLTIEQYAGLFSMAGNAVCKGEISPSYLWVPGAAERIRRVLGPIKIVIILRNPVERAFSDFSYSQRSGYNRIPFRDFLQQAQPLLQKMQLTRAPFHPTAILWKGFYARQLKAYLDAFGAGRVYVRLLDDMITDAPGFRKSLTAFLGVTDDPSISLRRVNESQASEKLSDDIRGWLSSVYRDDIHRLEKMLDRDLGAWLQ